MTTFREEQQTQEYGQTGILPLSLLGLVSNQLDVNGPPRKILLLLLLSCFSRVRLCATP